MSSLAVASSLRFKREDFEGFGAPFKERGVRTNQSLELIRRALVGETVTFKSEFYDFQKARSRRGPIQKFHPSIWLGGFTPSMGEARRFQTFPSSRRNGVVRPETAARSR
jgi:alkanesulfonate monooxygenase SsuD/methylene tetrahydromethanopterin reductase-like flavin-dependent oxidoreductase (luciferase family)